MTKYEVLSSVNNYFGMPVANCTIEEINAVIARSTDKSEFSWLLAKLPTDVYRQLAATHGLNPQAPKITQSAMSISDRRWMLLLLEEYSLEERFAAW